MNNTTPIRLFVDAHVFDGPYQGTRSFIGGIYRELAGRAGIELYLAARNVDALKEYFGENAGVRFVPLRSRSSYRRLLLEIPALLRRHRIDFAHFQYIAPPLKQCRYIVTTHDVLFCDLPGDFSTGYRLLKRWLYRRTAQRADILSTVSAHAQHAMQQHLGINPERVHLVPNGVSPHFYGGTPKAEAARYILERYGLQRYVLLLSRFEPRKNHVLLLRLFFESGLHRQGYSLVFIGSRTLPVPGLDEAIGALSEEESAALHLLPAVPAGDLPYFYKAAELFFYPSRGEGFGIPPLEAAAAGTPVLCSNALALGDFDFFGPDHLDP
ncbi:MAG: glycosyltransferase family 1 protein, partial [Chitinophagaceae bacterium]